MIKSNVSNSDSSPSSETGLKKTHSVSFIHKVGRLIIMIENTWIDVNVLMRIMMSLVTWRGSLVVKTEKLWATALRH